MIEQTRTDRARMLRRCRRPALSSMEYSMIVSELDEISGACCDIHYFCDDDTTLLDAMDGDDEAEYEFRMAFSVLDEKVDALLDALRRAEWAEPYDDQYDPEADFNSCLVALVGSFYRERGDSIWGWDAGAGDFFDLSPLEDYTIKGAVKRLCRKTKPQMVVSIQHTLRIFLAMIDIREEFDYIKNAFDIVKDENAALLKTIRSIESAFEAADEVSFGFQFKHLKEVRDFDRLISTLPDRCWVE